MEGSNVITEYISERDLSWINTKVSGTVLIHFDRSIVKRSACHAVTNNLFDTGIYLRYIYIFSV